MEDAAQGVECLKGKALARPERMVPPKDTDVPDRGGVQLPSTFHLPPKDEQDNKGADKERRGSQPREAGGLKSEDGPGALKKLLHERWHGHF